MLKRKARNKGCCSKRLRLNSNSKLSNKHDSKPLMLLGRGRLKALARFKLGRLAQYKRFRSIIKKALAFNNRICRLARKRLISLHSSMALAAHIRNSRRLNSFRWIQAMPSGFSKVSKRC
jgi:hypothetical protein